MPLEIIIKMEHQSSCIYLCVFNGNEICKTKLWMLKALIQWIGIAQAMTVSSEYLTYNNYFHELQRGDMVQNVLYDYHEKPQHFMFYLI